MRVYGYTLEEVNVLLKKYLSVIMTPRFMVDGAPIDLDILISTPDEEYAVKTFPAVRLETYSVFVDPDWQPEPEQTLMPNPDDDTLVDTLTQRFTEVFYTYKVSCNALFKGHMNTLEIDMAQIPLDITLSGYSDNLADNFLVPFKWDGKIISMDDAETSAVLASLQLNEETVANGSKVYRRYMLLTAQILLEKSFVETSLRPYLGARFTFNSK